MTNPKLEFSVDKCFELFGQSFNRVKFFSCITDNVTADIFPKDWSIKRESGVAYGVTEKPPTEQETSMLVNGYRHFMQRYLVRDCIENFASSLDTLFLMLSLNGKQIFPKKDLNFQNINLHELQEFLSQEELEIFENFKNAGLFGKMQILENRFNLRLITDHKRIITNLKDIRNCLSHNNGIVRPTDGKKDGKEKRKFHWIVLHMFAIGRSGKEFEIEFGKPFKEEAKICLKLRDNSKSFQIGQPLSFSSADTYEIALSLDFVVREFCRKINETAHQQSIEVIEKVGVENEK